MDSPTPSKLPAAACPMRARKAKRPSHRLQQGLVILGVKETLNMQPLSTQVSKTLEKRDQGPPAKWAQELRPTRSLHCC